MEETAAMRYVLRNTFKLALEMQEYIRLVDVDGLACSRLARLLVASRTEYDRQEADLKEAILQGIRQAGEEMGLYD